MTLMWSFCFRVDSNKKPSVWDVSRLQLATRELSRIKSFWSVTHFSRSAFCCCWWLWILLCVCCTDYSFYNFPFFLYVPSHFALIPLVVTYTIIRLSERVNFDGWQFCVDICVWEFSLLKNAPHSRRDNNLILWGRNSLAWNKHMLFSADRCNPSHTDHSREIRGKYQVFFNENNWKKNSFRPQEKKGGQKEREKKNRRRRSRTRTRNDHEIQFLIRCRCIGKIEYNKNSERKIMFESVNHVRFIFDWLNLDFLQYSTSFVGFVYSPSFCIVFSFNME